ncbi:hypothetical protein ABZ572_17400 [Streptomyces sp. NPDC018338]|uniref:hypothetical protein n=1 Tax=Streptomyces sp. NPDC018338 TaxID=3157192 RepID=UPI0033F1DCA1
MVSTDDQAARLAIVGGAKPFESLPTGRLSVTLMPGSITKAARILDAGLWEAA